jgi:RNA-directed DNA polymerase
LHLELSEDKTRITRVTEGFDFLGFHVRWRTPSNGKPWLCVTPTRKSEQRLRTTVKQMTDRAMSWEPVPEKIRAINRVLRGWGNYYRHVSSSRVREKLDWWVSQRMLKWLCQRHKGLGKRKILAQYNIRQGGRRRNWGTGEGADKTYLLLLRDVKYSAYRRKKRANPYLDIETETLPGWQLDNPHVKTWDGTTNQHKAEWWTIRTQALKRDHYQCIMCGSTEELHIHHIKPSGGDRMGNLLTLCHSCHKQTATYGRNRQMQRG